MRGHPPKVGRRRTWFVRRSVARARQRRSLPASLAGWAFFSSLLVPVRPERAVLPVGKLPAPVLARLLASHPVADPRIIVGPRVGEDAAVLDMGDRYLVAKTDPSTFAAEAIGWYAVHINANDVACAGGAPRWFLMSLLLPEGGATADLAEAIFEQVRAACREVGAELVGGHTEITAGLDRPILVGSMLGE